MTALLRPSGRPWRRAALSGALLAALVAGPGGCRRSPPPAPPPPPPPSLGQVTVVDVLGERSGRPLDTDAMVAEIRRQLAGSGLVAGVVAAAFDGGGAAAANGPPGTSGGARDRSVLTARGEIAAETVEVDSKGLVRVSVRLRLATRPQLGPGGIDEDLTAGAERPYEVRAGLDRQALRQQVAEQASADLLSAFIARRRLATVPPAALRAALASDAGGGLREEAIRQIGARGLKDEAPALLPLLHDPDEDIRDAALGALLALGDRRAVRELTRSRSLRDRREMGKILEAIATLGGDEAREYLGFVAESHDDEDIRGLAAEARRRLEQRASGGRSARP